MIPGCRSAFATAESSTFTTGSVAPSGENFSTRRASSTCRPRMSSIPRRALRGETRRYFAVAFASIPLLLQRRAALGVVSVRPERARRGELPELVTDHRLGDVDRHVLAAVVHRDGVSDHVRHDRRTPRPRADHALVVALVHVRHLDHQVLVDERTFLDRARHLAPSLSSAADDHLGGRLLLVPRPALLLAPRGRRMPSGGAVALAAAERVVARVHRDAAHGRALVLPSRPASLAELHQLVLGVADDADRRAAGRLDQTHLPGGKPQGRIPALLRDELHGGSRRARHVRPAARLELHRMDHGADRDVAERQGVPRPDLRALAGHQSVADAQSLGREDVTLLAVDVVEQRDARAPVRVVLDVRHLRRHAVLVPPEVDGSEPSLVAAALVPRGDAALRVAAGALAPLLHERLLRTGARDLLETGDARSAASRA